MYKVVILKKDSNEKIILNYEDSSDITGLLACLPFELNDIKIIITYHE